MSNKSMTEPELKEFLTALKDSCGNKEKEQWYMGLIEDFEIAFTEDHIPDAGKMVKENNDTKLASKIASTRDKPFFVDIVRGLINSYLKEDISTSKLVEELNITAFKWCEKRESLSKNEDKSLYETQICLQTLINRIRQAVNKKELILSVPFQKAFDNALYIIKKYSTPSDAFKIVQSELINEPELKTKFIEVINQEFGNLVFTPLANKCAQIAKQYSDSKLSELEKWIDEEIKKAFTLPKPENEWIEAAHLTVKDKIQSLK